MVGSQRPYKEGPLENQALDSTRRPTRSKRAKACVIMQLRRDPQGPKDVRNYAHVSTSSSGLVVEFLGGDDSLEFQRCSSNSGNVMTSSDGRVCRIGSGETKWMMLVDVNATGDCSSVEGLPRKMNRKQKGQGTGDKRQRAPVMIYNADTNRQWAASQRI